jgi:vacuolar-type H+-ATPase subunit F/Vma7
MSRLLVITDPHLATGFHLAGVAAFAAANAQAAQQLVARLLDEGESGLLAIDEELLAGLDAAVRQRLAAAEHLPHLALPGRQAAGAELAGTGRIARLLREAIGFHITFQNEPS